MTSMEDVARRAGVAAITVSRTMRNDPRVRPETRERVLRAVEELNYIPNAVARSLKQARSGMIALLITDMTSSFLHDAAKGAADAARRFGWSLLLGNSVDDPELEAAYLRRMGEHRIEGIVMMPTLLAPDSIRLSLPRETPIVLLDRNLPQVHADSVTCDTRTGVAKLTEHLIALGHRRIALVGGSPVTATWAERIAGFKATMEKHQIDSFTIIDGDYQESGARKGMQRLFAMGPLPDVIIAANSQVAVAILSELTAAGKGVPRNVGLASVDDPFPGSPFWPRVTFVEQPGYEMGKRAVELLAARLLGEDTSPEPKSVVFEAKLRIGESCGEDATSAAVGRQSASR